ncbi:glycosyltransferase [Halobaculum sp. WSA2]|uniref:Glycosyltransferase n=1 Tax=Halobaculum saliterrae TaxID=2073113 RepID=A0A6B0SNB1_9EURY|nr:glycosyltransferase family 2 protein [Halobaculum saliterrae]MXR40374.1 glycosyltransferase [Halobaculum saliterrae]
MYRGHTVGVVIPAYNEEPFVRETILTVPAFVDRIYVVDDSSTDDTWAEIRRAKALDRRRSDRGEPAGERSRIRRNGEDGPAREDPERPRADDSFDDRIVAIQHEENRGVGGAIKTGYLRARDDEVAATAVMGGDGQMDPDVLETLFDPIVDGEADYVKGNRFAGRRDRGDMPRLRFVGNAVLGALTKIASGYWSTGDPQSGYTAISRRALHEADIENMYEFYGYCNDLLVKLNVARLRVVDLPNPIIYGDEESHIRYRTYVPRVSWMLFRNFLWRLRTNYLAYDFHPLVLAYGVGAGSIAVGALGTLSALGGLGGAATSVRLLGGLVSSLAFVVGACAFIGAMAMDMRDNDHLDEVILPDRGDPVGPAAGPGPGDASSVADDARLNGSGRAREAGSALESDGGREAAPSGSDRDAPAEGAPAEDAVE